MIRDYTVFIYHSYNKLKGRLYIVTSPCTLVMRHYYIDSSLCTSLYIKPLPDTLINFSSSCCLPTHQHQLQRTQSDVCAMQMHRAYSDVCAMQLHRAYSDVCAIQLHRAYSDVCAMQLHRAYSDVCAMQLHRAYSDVCHAAAQSLQ